LKVYCLFQRQLSTTDMHHKGMASSQLPEFIRNDQWPPDSPWPWTILPRWDVGGLLQAPSETHVNHRTQ